MPGGTEQLPANTFAVGGLQTISGWQLPAEQYGIVEDSESKTTALGQWKADISYSRRPTLKVTLEMLYTATVGTVLATYCKGGTIASGVLTDAAGTATGWKIQNVSISKSRGVVQMELDLIGLADYLVVT
jgi:hypothetical protein